MKPCLLYHRETGRIFPFACNEQQREYLDTHNKPLLVRDTGDLLLPTNDETLSLKEKIDGLFAEINNCTNAIAHEFELMRTKVEL